MFKFSRVKAKNRKIKTTIYKKTLIGLLLKTRKRLKVGKKYYLGKISTKVKKILEFLLILEDLQTLKKGIKIKKLEITIGKTGKISFN